MTGNETNLRREIKRNSGATWRCLAMARSCSFHLRKKAKDRRCGELAADYLEKQKGRWSCVRGLESEGHPSSSCEKKRGAGQGGGWRLGK